MPSLQMQAGVQQVRHDPQIRTVILKSNAPGIFCAGADLKERKEMTERQVHTHTHTHTHTRFYRSFSVVGCGVHSCSSKNNSGPF